ncbi:MAG: sialate O-acetylesterase [Lewinella sp.]
MNSPRLILLVLFLFQFSGDILCEIVLPDIISDGMVLQRYQLVPIWGKAESGQEISIDFNGQTESDVADENGNWFIVFDPMPHSAEPLTMDIKGDETITLKNILIGEVWFCSGQSNMQWEVQQSEGGKEAIANADFPNIRLFNVDRDVGFKKKPGKLATWQGANPESVKKFSGVGYFFALKIHQELDVPIAMINASFGGTQAEAWTPRYALAAFPELQPCIDREKIWEAERPEVQKEFDKRMVKWKENVKKAKANKTKTPSRLRVPDALRPQRIAGSIYYNMVEPLVPFAIGGALWYQGESNEDRAEQYELLLTVMIESWREEWHRGNFPFAIVQLPNFRKQKEQPADEAWSHLRDSQLKVHKKLPNTGLIVTIDIGEANDIHPVNKLDVADRLARWAMAEVYGKDIQGSGPLFSEVKLKKRKAIISFKEVGEGLKTTDGAELQEFAIAGEDQQWVWAKAKIKGKNKVVVRSGKIINPKAVRYAFNNNPKNPNLTNASGLPAGPFRTDDWKGPTAGKR